MIKLWIDYYRLPLRLQKDMRFSSDGLVRLSSALWFSSYRCLCDIKVDGDLLSKGFKV